jgi:hypothetical protein
MIGRISTCNNRIKEGKVDFILLTWLAQTAKKTFRQNTVRSERSTSNWHLKYERDNKALPSGSYGL